MQNLQGEVNSGREGDKEMRSDDANQPDKNLSSNASSVANRKIRRRKQANPCKMNAPLVRQQYNEVWGKFHFWPKSEDFGTILNHCDFNESKKL